VSNDKCCLEECMYEWAPEPKLQTCNMDMDTTGMQHTEHKQARPLHIATVTAPHRSRGMEASINDSLHTSQPFKGVTALVMFLPCSCHGFALLGIGCDCPASQQRHGGQHQLLTAHTHLPAVRHGGGSPAMNHMWCQQTRTWRVAVKQHCPAAQQGHAIALQRSKGIIT
jgi:hypothetical protein